MKRCTKIQAITPINFVSCRGRLYESTKSADGTGRAVWSKAVWSLLVQKCVFYFASSLC